MKQFPDMRNQDHKNIIMCVFMHSFCDWSLNFPVHWGVNKCQQFQKGVWKIFAFNIWKPLAHAHGCVCIYKWKRRGITGKERDLNVCELHHKNEVILKSACLCLSFSISNTKTLLQELCPVYLSVLLLFLRLSEIQGSPFTVECLTLSWKVFWLLKLQGWI